MPQLGIATATGYQAYEKIFVRHRIAEAVALLAAFVLCFWGLLQMAQARGTMMEKVTATSTTRSFVEDSVSDDAPLDSGSGESLERTVRRLLGSAIVKIMLSADIILGILIGLFMKIRTQEDFAAWQELKKEARQLALLERLLNERLSTIESAKKRCMSGILRGMHVRQKRCVPYHQVLPGLLIATVLTGTFLAGTPMFGQTTSHHEGILLDVSGSIGKGSADRELFHEYLLAVKTLLLTELPQTRVWVSIITTESFGSIGSLVKGWTPDSQGVFTDDLNRARHQLAASFEAKSAGLKPTAAGTDIIGGLWQLKAQMESGGKSSRGDSSKTIWIVSDMMNESVNFNMPALLPTGPVKIIERARANDLIVPLKGYRVYVVGASPAGLNPRTWNVLRTFWTLYFREAGADLIVYSVGCSVERE